MNPKSSTSVPHTGTPLTLSDPSADAHDMPPNAVIECGWGRWLPAQTYADPRDLATALL